MKAAYVKVGGGVEIRELPCPVPGPGQVVLRIVACGVCGSDYLEIGYWAKDWKRFGHELTAVVHTVGDGVEGFMPGDRVALALSAPCGRCEACTRGTPRFCTGLVVAEQGGFAEFLLVPDTRLLHKLQVELPSATLCLAEPLSVILDAFDEVRLDPARDTLFVAGGGFLGGLALLAAKALGGTVAGVLARRETMALRTILSRTGGVFVPWPKGFWRRRSLSSSPELNTALRRNPGRVVVLHTVPPAAIADYVAALPFGAEVVNIGLSGKARENQIRLDGAQNVFRRIQIHVGFPVPCLSMDAALSLLQQHHNIFSILEFEEISLSHLDNVLRNPSHGKKIVTM